MSLAFTLSLAFMALLIEAIFGYPAFVYAVLRHPVTWVGWLITKLEARLNRPEWPDLKRKRAGIAALAILLTLVAAIGFIITALLSHNIFGLVALVLIATTLMAQSSLYEHCLAVAEALGCGNVEAGRRAVAMIVGRDVAALDEAGMSRAAIESLAENFSDGIVGPAFWTAVLGLPGGFIYKAANTADSMIGHMNERYLNFGWAAARFDDYINLPASRLSALWLIVAAATLPDADPHAAYQTVRRDARHHRSPNAGWPEAAMAGALGFKLGGPRSYSGVTVSDVTMGDGEDKLDARDIYRALALYRRACVAQMAALALLVLIIVLI